MAGPNRRTTVAKTAMVGTMMGSRKTPMKSEYAVATTTMLTRSLTGAGHPIDVS